MFYLFLILVSFCANIQSTDIIIRYRENYDYRNRFARVNEVQDLVKIDLYYETLCPYCRSYYPQQLEPVVNKLGRHLDVHTYPYGNARTYKRNGKIQIKCQHGPKECYGNQLHACSIDILQNVTEYVIFNACLMNGYSDDAAADECGNSLNIDSEPIKECAKSDRGFQLLKFYGEETAKVNLHGVPYALVNSVPSDNDLMHDVCTAFKHPPEECKNVL